MLVKVISLRQFLYFYKFPDNFFETSQSITERPKMKTDLKLLEGLKRGESSAFEQVYRNYYRMVETYVLKNNGSSDDAQDVFQDTLIALSKSVQKPEFKLYAKLSTFIYGISSRVWLLKLRNRKEMLPLEMEEFERNNVESEMAIAEKELFEEKHLLMSKVLEELKDDCRQLLISYYFKRIQLKKIAKIMGYTEAFVKVKKNRCMNAFRKKVLEHPDYQDFMEN